MSKQDRAVMFFSAPASKYLPYFRKHKINTLLLSYWYIRQKKSDYYKIVEYLKEVNGILMVDSGAHTFKHDDDPKWLDPKNYPAYIDEFVGFCYDNADDIFCTVNIDMDHKLGIDIVDRWNHDIFVPLNKKVNVIFNVDAHTCRRGHIDKTGLSRFKEYCEDGFKYVGMNRGMIKNVSQVYSLASQYNVRVHGFALTSLSVLKTTPLFSVDSSSWLSGSRYGSTFTYDGKNFRSLDGKKKYIRKNNKLLCEDKGIDFESLLGDKDPGITDFNLMAWKGFEQEYLSVANIKLKTAQVKFYCKS